MTHAEGLRLVSASVSGDWRVGCPDGYPLLSFDQGRLPSVSAWGAQLKAEAVQSDREPLGMRIFEGVILALLITGMS